MTAPVGTVDMSMRPLNFYRNRTVDAVMHIFVHIFWRIKICLCLPGSTLPIFRSNGAGRDDSVKMPWCWITWYVALMCPGVCVCRLWCTRMTRACRTRAPGQRTPGPGATPTSGSLRLTTSWFTAPSMWLVCETRGKEEERERKNWKLYWIRTISWKCHLSTIQSLTLKYA